LRADSPKPPFFTQNGGKISGNIVNPGDSSAYGGGGGVYVKSGTFTMHGGAISGNTASPSSVSAYGGGVFVGWHNSSGTVRIINGTIYGNTETFTSLRSTAANGAAFYNGGSGVIQYGTFTGGVWNGNGTLTTTNATIKVVNGMLQTPEEAAGLVLHRQIQESDFSWSDAPFKGKLSDSTTNEIKALTGIMRIDISGTIDSDFKAGWGIGMLGEGTDGYSILVPSTAPSSGSYSFTIDVPINEIPLFSDSYDTNVIYINYWAGTITKIEIWKLGT
jgi:hypothetical protein